MLFKPRNTFLNLRIVNGNTTRPQRPQSCCSHTSIDTYCPRGTVINQIVEPSTRFSLVPSNPLLGTCPSVGRNINPPLLCSIEGIDNHIHVRAIGTITVSPTAIVAIVCELTAADGQLLFD